MATVTTGRHLTLAEAAAAVGRSERQVMRLRAAGRLAVVRQGRRVLVPEAELSRLRQELLRIHRLA